MRPLEVWFAAGVLLSILAISAMCVRMSAGDRQAAARTRAAYHDALVLGSRTDPVERARLTWIVAETESCASGFNVAIAEVKEDEWVRLCAGRSLDRIARQSPTLARALAGELVAARRAVPLRWADATQGPAYLRAAESAFDFH
jgi:hypothetical protein